MPSARDAKEWAASGGLHGIGNSLYTPFSGTDGDAIDLDAYRALVRYCVGDLGHPMLWLTSGIAEWWSLTMDERKQLVEVAIEEARAIAPDTVIQACTSAAAAKDCVELTQHAEAAGADICYLQTPPMEVHGGEGVLRYFQYVAARTDIALGMFNSPSSGYVLTPEDVARIATEVPAVCATKEGTLEHWRSKAAHALAPDLVIWECDGIVYRAGWLQQGIVGPAQLGTAGYLHEIPDQRILTDYWNLIWAGRLEEAIEHARETGLDRVVEEVSHWYIRYPGRPDYFSHWGEAFRYAATVVGLPMGDYPHSRPPQAILPEVAKEQIRALYESVGFAKQLTNV
ncbi:MAG TPA: dihydrodipicolinate synthase family protein [Acidimicrobiia bacterium]|nr:dihydrodipicolinate synthase family protein [Acidimicrobiia bacterium]